MRSREEAAKKKMRQRGRVARISWRLRLAGFWLFRGDLDEAARHGRQAVRLARRHPLSTPAELAVDAGLTMAHIERDRAEYAAGLDSLLWAMGLMPRLAPGDRDRTAVRAWSALADLHRRAGRYSEAAAALVRARELAESARPVEPARLAAVVMLEGIVAKELGELDRAEGCYATAAAILQRDGCVPADAAALQHNLAGLAHARGDFERAERHARRAVALRRAVAGPDQVALAEDLAVLAAAVAGQDRYDEARELFAQTLAICRSARPARDYEIAVHLHNLAAIEQACGHFEEAGRLYRQALDTKERLLGPGHPEIAQLLNNLGTLLHDQRHATQAAHCFQRALGIARRAYPPEHPTTKAIRRHLAALNND